MAISIAGTVTLLVGLVVLGVVYWLVAYIVRTLPIADPLGRIILIVAMILCVVIAVVLLLNWAGISSTPIHVTS